MDTLALGLCLICLLFISFVCIVEKATNSTKKELTERGQFGYEVAKTNRLFQKKDQYHDEPFRRAA